MKRGFTLIELLIVIVIVGILATTGISIYGGMIERSRAAEAWIILSNIINSEKRLYLQNTSYTSDLNDLDVEITNPSQNFNFAFNDPWAIANRIEEGGGRKSYRLKLDGTIESIDGTY